MMKVGVDWMSYCCWPVEPRLEHGVLERLVGEAGVDLGLAQPAQLRQLLERLHRIVGPRPALLLGEEHVDELRVALRPGAVRDHRPP